MKNIEELTKKEIPEILKNRTFSIGVMCDANENYYVSYVTEVINQKGGSGWANRAQTDNKEIRIALMPYEVDVIELTKDFIPCQTYVWTYTFTENDWSCSNSDNVMSFDEKSVTIYDDFLTRQGYFKKYYRGNNSLLQKAADFSKYSCDGKAIINYEKRFLARKEYDVPTGKFKLVWQDMKPNGTLYDVVNEIFIERA